MARSSDFPTSNSNIVWWLEAIQNSQNVSGNTSSVTVRLWIKRTNSGYVSYGTGSCYITINGTQYTESITTSDKITSTPLKLMEKTVTVPHNSDGTKVLGMGADITHSVFSTAYQSWSMTLSTIARSSKPTVYYAERYFTNTQTIYMNRASSSFTHTVRYVFGGSSGTIETGVTDVCYWAIPASLMTEIPTKLSGTMTIYVDTYNGSTKIGTQYVQFEVNVPTSTVPSFTTVTHSENVANVATKIGSYVQGMSKLNLAITGATGVYGSTISKYEITFEGVTYTASSTVSGLIKGSGSLTITGKITDSRGRTASKSVTVSALAYTPPRITAFTVQRANSDGSLNDMGVYAKITRAGNWDTLGSKNNLTIKIFSKTRSATTWTEKSSVVATTGTYNGSTVLGTYLETTSHDFRLDVIDQFNTTMSITVMPTGLVTMSWSTSGIGIGKVWERGVLDAKGNIYVDGLIDATGNLNVQGRADVAGMLRVAGGFDSIRIPANSNLNDYGNVGFYYSPANVDVATMSNVPVGSAFSLLVEKHAGIKQTLTTFMTSDFTIWVRNYYAGNWGPWVRQEWSDVPSLWQGGYMMSNGQSVSPTKRLSACRNGWMLVFSNYLAGTGSQNKEWNTAFVSKAQRLGEWHHFVIGVQGWVVTSKYLQIYDDAIIGHSGNGDSPRSTAVLRGVYEW